MMHLHLWQWVIAGASATLIGLSKTGVPGMGILAIVIFANALPSRASVGIVLPILIVGDIIAVSSYKRHAVWAHLWRLFPWAAVGVVLGWLTMKHLDNEQVSKLIGVTVTVLVVIQFLKMRADKKSGVTGADKPLHPTVAPIMGVAGGFTTMVANAAGPIMVLYLLSAGLPKMEFIGTGAWYFLTLNIFKVPFMAQQGLINPSSLVIDAILAPFVIAGALWGRVVLRKLDQEVFNRVALALTLVAAVKLLF